MRAVLRIPMPLTTGARAGREVCRYVGAGLSAKGPPFCAYLSAEQEHEWASTRPQPAKGNIVSRNAKKENPSKDGHADNDR